MTREVRRMPDSDVPALMTALRAALDGTGPAILPFDAARPRADADNAPVGSAEPNGGHDLAVVPDTVALVIETSGSTGTPKRVALSARALLASAEASAAAVGGTGQWLLCLPAHYVAGTNVLVRSIHAGTDPVVMPEGHFDAAGFVEASARLTAPHRYASVVPVQLARLIDAAEEDAEVTEALRRFDALLVGGQALRPELRQRAEALGIRAVRTYGSSETSGGCVYDGVPIGATRARVAPDGMLELTGPTLAEGYLGDPERTASAFDTDADGTRWYRTGDLGEVAADGAVTVLGRADNVIISGGEKVLLDAVERHVKSLPGLGDAVVVAADDAQWGQVPVVITATGASAELAGIRASTAAALGRAAAPARLVVVDAIPHLPSGKPDRLALAQLAANRD
ncbi:o-succinylbenzoate--CoA ligase [Gryllotalpicola daejeonensis]|uniref:O-succinylbenzoate--CoA ligase n=1 Tax=Gryllotalpicola daejeonensis TaxID=993087 RepID=A0ABP7ZLY8_9MICO